MTVSGRYCTVLRAGKGVPGARGEETISLAAERSAVLGLFTVASYFAKTPNLNGLRVLKRNLSNKEPVLNMSKHLMHCNIFYIHADFSIS